MLIIKNINPLLLGTWILRASNDKNIPLGINYIEINDEPSIKFKTLKQDNLIGIKCSRSASISKIKRIKQNSFIFTLQYIKKNIYSYSFLGISIPELKSESVPYSIEKNLTINIFERTIIVNDKTQVDEDLYYIFDLNIGKIRYPNIETNINTFIFSQLFSILLGIILTKLL